MLPFDSIHVLLIEDDMDYAQLLRLRLSLVDCARFYPDSSSNRPIKFTHVTVFGQALELLAERAFHLILLDLALPDSDGLDSLRLLAEQYSSLPVVVITGAYDEELASCALQLGAQDYLLKEKIPGHGAHSIVVLDVGQQVVLRLLLTLYLCDKLRPFQVRT